MEECAAQGYKYVWKGLIRLDKQEIASAQVLAMGRAQKPSKALLQL